LRANDDAVASAQLHSKRTKNGLHYYGVWYDPARDPKRIWRTLRTQDKKAARQRLAQQEQLHALGQYDPWTDPTGDDAITVATAVADYLKEARTSMRDPSVRALSSRLSPFALLHGATPLRSIDAGHVERFVATLRGRKDKDAKGPAPPAAPNTRHAYWSALYGLFTWATKRGHLRTHPLKHRRGEPPAADSDFHVFSPEELARLCNAVREDARQVRRRGRAYLADVVEFAVCSGLRISEICALEWGAVRLEPADSTSLQAAEIKVASRSARPGRRAFTTKSGRSRTLPVWPRGARALHRLRERAEQVLGRHVRPHDPVVVGERGRPLERSIVGKLFRTYADEAGLSHATFHDTRHTFISWGVNELSLPVTVVQELVGHADVRLTVSYLRVSAATMQEAIMRALAAAGVSSPPPGPPPSYVRVARYVAGYDEAAPGEGSTPVLQSGPETAPD
jgi:integrase